VSSVLANGGLAGRLAGRWVRLAVSRVVGWELNGGVETISWEDGEEPAID
jgi:hypothetical protein